MRNERCVLAGVALGYLVCPAAMTAQMAMAGLFTVLPDERVARLGDAFGMLAGAPLLLLDRMLGGSIDWSFGGAGLAISMLLWTGLGYLGGRVWCYVAALHGMSAGEANRARRRRIRKHVLLVVTGVTLVLGLAVLSLTRR